MLDPHPNLTSEVIFGLGWMYSILFVMNAWWTVRSLKRDGQVRIRLMGLLGEGAEVPVAAFWGFYSAMLSLFAMAHFAGSGNPEAFLIKLPEWFKNTVDIWIADPVAYFGLATFVFVLMFLVRRWLVKPTVGWCLLNAALLFLVLSMTDWDFRQIVGKPDNVPIVSMLFIVGFFTWLYFSRAVENDNRREQGLPLLEEDENEKVLVWPDLVYTELICMIAVTVLLIAWGIALQAPLEEPASSVRTPNPSKAPWYFLGLQEMLVYYDPWLAGVVFPSLILVGLMAIPYIDFNKKGAGYYTFNERKFAVVTFMFGFLPLWVAMIILGTFLRGPNWNIFGIYEYWDVHKLEALINVNLSEGFWVYPPDWVPWKGQLPKAPPNAPRHIEIGYIMLREAPGFILVFLYLLAIPPILASTVLRSFFYRMGFIRFFVFTQLLLLMAALPLKMVLRWVFNLKYLIAIPEWFFNV